MNRIILSGGLTRDAEFRKGGNDLSVVTFSLGVRDFSRKDENGNYASMYFNVVCYGQIADRLFKNTHKGSQILVEGKVRQNSYVNKNGVKVTTTEVVADNFELIGAKDSKDAADPVAPVEAAPVVKEESKNVDTLDAEVEDDMPF